MKECHKTQFLSYLDKFMSSEWYGTKHTAFDNVLAHIKNLF